MHNLCVQRQDTTGTCEGKEPLPPAQPELTLPKYHCGKLCSL